MSIRSLFNHQVRVYREPDAESSRDGLGYVDAVPLPVGEAPEVLNARPDQDWGGALQDRGPGDQQTTLRRWFLDRNVPVEERDVLSVLEGPEAGLLLRVMSKTTVSGRRSVHHIEVMVAVWIGELGEEEST